MRKMMIGLVLIVALGLPALAEDPLPAPADKKAAYRLLDSLGQMFHEMAVTGSGGKDTLEKSLQQFMAEAKKAKDEQRIDAIFFNRYARLLAVIKLITAPDPGGILVPIIDREMSRFVAEVLGDDWQGSGAKAVGQVADAVAYEIIDLQMYLENPETRERLRKDWDKKFSDVLPKK